MRDYFLITFENTRYIETPPGSLGMHVMIGTSSMPRQGTPIIHYDTSCTNEWNRRLIGPPAIIRQSVLATIWKNWRSR